MDISEKGYIQKKIYYKKDITEKRYINKKYIKNKYIFFGYIIVQNIFFITDISWLYLILF